MVKARACYGITLTITFIILSASRNAKYRKRTEKSLANIDNIVYIYRVSQKKRSANLEF